MNKAIGERISCPKCTGEVYYPTRWEIEEMAPPGCLLSWEKRKI